MDLVPGQVRREVRGNTDQRRGTVYFPVMLRTGFITQETRFYACLETPLCFTGWRCPSTHSPGIRGLSAIYIQVSVWHALVPEPRVGGAGCKHHIQASVTPALTVLTLLGNELCASNSALCNAGQEVRGVASAVEDKPGFWVGRAPPFKGTRVQKRVRAFCT